MLQVLYVQEASARPLKGAPLPRLALGLLNPFRWAGDLRTYRARAVEPGPNSPLSCNGEGASSSIRKSEVDAHFTVL